MDFDTLCLNRISINQDTEILNSDFVTRKLTPELELLANLIFQGKQICSESQRLTGLALISRGQIDFTQMCTQPRLVPADKSATCFKSAV